MPSTWRFRLSSDSNDEQYLARGFRNVDSADAGKMASCLQYLNSLPAVQAYKATMLRMMDPAPGSKTADLGCGLGFDVRRLAPLVGPEGKAIGVDASHALLASARLLSKDLLNVEFLAADIRSLPFPDAYLDTCKIDRVLQHVEQPERVLHEAFRITRPGGRVVCAEPDWGTFSIDSGDAVVDAQISKNWAESFRNPRIGQRLPSLLDDAGFVILETQQQILVTETFASSDLVFDTAQTAARLKLPLPSDREVRCAVTIFLFSAQVP
jgi:ubiquinone/menaquinone biosynthesis C-methylase UbiE